jgi:hypothetical protein
MKTYLPVLMGALALNLAAAQPVAVAGGPVPKADEKASLNALPRFDLEFPGGTPRELVRAIEKASSRPLNTIIPDEFANVKLPAVSVRNVTAAEVFAVLEIASRTNERHVWTDHTTPNRNPADFYFEHVSNYGFRTDGKPAENSIWYFYYDRPPIQVEPVVCKFFQLGPHLEAGYSVDEIMTAVQTGWKMLGVTNPPHMTIHRETKILIAVGENDKVELIGDVLKQLPPQKSKAKPVFE